MRQAEPISQIALRGSIKRLLIVLLEIRNAQIRPRRTNLVSFEKAFFLATVAEINSNVIRTLALSTIL